MTTVRRRHQASNFGVSPAAGLFSQINEFAPQTVLAGVAVGAGLATAATLLLRPLLTRLIDWVKPTRLRQLATASGPLPSPR